MLLKISLLIIIALLFFTCKKEKVKIVYNGDVISQPNYCTSGTGFPFIIKYIDKTNNYDTIITTTLPVQYKFIGQKIEFEMRDLSQGDEGIVCTDLFKVPKQVIIFNVSPL